MRKIEKIEERGMEFLKRLGAALGILCVCAAVAMFLPLIWIRTLCPIGMIFTACAIGVVTFCLSGAFFRLGVLPCCAWAILQVSTIPLWSIEWWRLTDPWLQITLECIVIFLPMLLPCLAGMAFAAMGNWKWWRRAFIWSIQSATIWAIFMTFEGQASC